MDRLYEQVDTITRKKQHENLVQFKEQAFLSRRLVTIDRNVPLEFIPENYKAGAPDNEKLAELFKELEFRRLQQDFPKKPDLSNKQYHAIYTEDELSGLIERLEASGLFALDTETTSKDAMRADLVGLSFSVKPDEAYYIPCGHDYPDVPEQLDKEYVLERLKPLLENPGIKKVGQNIKYDWMVLARNGVDPAGAVFDTMLASYLLNPAKRAHSLDQIALDFLDYRTIPYSDVIKNAEDGGKNGFAAVPLKQGVSYACEDADITLMAWQALKKEIEQAGLDKLMDEVEMPLVSVLMEMEISGICVDAERLKSLSASFEKRLEALKQSIFLSAGEEFNINSSQQLGSILFEKLNLPVQKKTKKKTGYSTDVDVLTKLAPMHELPDLILKYRTLAKLKSTYTDALLGLIHPETGRVHTSFNQTITATGRLSSSRPNLQNIPIRGDEGLEIRKAFIPRAGWMLVAADYSQIELRILAHYSDDDILIKAFRDEEDIHTRTATEVFQVFPSFITADLRRQAKIINFGIIYGMSPYGLSKELNISRKMAQQYINSYFARYKGVKRFIDQTITRAAETGKTSTLLGRVRLLPDINSPKKTLREYAERTAVNTPIQGTAADLIKLAMIRVGRAFKDKGLKSVMLLSVHDEIIFETPPEELEEAGELVRGIMEHVMNLKVPLKVNLGFGKNWVEAH
jgi:DNA polymerase-1